MPREAATPQADQCRDDLEDTGWEWPGLTGSLQTAVGWFPCSESGARGRRPAGHFVQVQAQHGEPERHGVLVSPRAGHERAEQLQSMCERLDVDGRGIGIQRADRPMDDDAAPLEQSLYLVHLERRPLMMCQDGGLRTSRGAIIDPPIGEYVVDRLDLHARTRCEGKPPQVVASENFFTLAPRQVSDRRFVHTGHASRAKPRVVVFVPSPQG